MTAHIQNFQAGFEDMISRRADATAVIDARTEKILSYAELDVLIRRTQVYLTELGLARNDTLVSMLPNGLEALLIFFAAARTGINFAPFSALCSPREAVEWAALVGSDAVIVSDSSSDETRDALTTAGVTWSKLVTDGSLSNLPEDAAGPDADTQEDSGLIYLQTSGTTGTPKVMVIDINRLWSSARAWVNQHSFLDEDTRFLNYLPVAYLGGLFNLCIIPLASGGSFVISEAFSGTSLLKFWNDVERFEINTLWLVPPILRGLLSLHGRTSGKHERAYKMIRAAFIGTAIIDQKTKVDGEKAFGFPILENFALSETTFITAETMEDCDNAERGVGRVLPYVEMRLNPLDSQPEGIDSEIGEIQVRSPFLFLGYRQPDGTIDSNRDDDDFFHTGDLARFASDGKTVLLEGRSREIIKKGGYLISLTEIEAIAQQHPSVEDVSAVGVPHEFYGEDVSLFVCFSANAGEHPEDALRIWLSENLAKFKWPSSIVAIDELPRTTSSKVQKFKLVR